MTQDAAYLLAGQASELERLRLQSRVWELAGRALLAKIPRPFLAHAVDIGCGAIGWLRALSVWAEDDGSVVGTDIDDRMLAAAKSFVEEERLANVTVLRDDLFDSRLPLSSFDLLHARFQIAPLGQAERQLESYLRRVKPGGWIVLEDPDMASWRVTPAAPSVEQLIALIREGCPARRGQLRRGPAVALSRARV
jgi:SAM-dependent methyltransferase